MKGNNMKIYILAALAVVLILVGLAFMGNAQADTDPWASVIENTDARLVCGNIWLDVVGEWWALGVGSQAIAMDFGPYNLLAKFEGLCWEQSD